MKRYFGAMIAVLVLATLFSACALPLPFLRPTEKEPPITEGTIPDVPSQPTEPSSVPTEPSAPEHSQLYLPYVSVEDVIVYFNEVCLDAEYSTNGNPSVIQKWQDPILYSVFGDPTQEDLEIIDSFAQWLNTIPGFPGIRLAETPDQANLEYNFCTENELINIMGSTYEGCDGAVTFWYDTDTNVINRATICVLNNLDPYLRRSVILEELYNGLGPVQDTELREDSIIYSYYSEPQNLTEIDELILKLLYHPSIRCGMDMNACEEVIRQLYY